MFSGNTNIVYFDELKYFTSLTTSPNFGNCTNLEHITLPLSITTLYGYGKCYKLVISSADGNQFPPNVTTVAYNAFFDCNAIQVYDFPATLIRMDAGIAGDNGSRKDFIAIFRSNTPPVRLNSNHDIFSFRLFTHVYVPDEALAVYKSAPDFSDNASKIYPLSEYVAP